MVKATNQVLPRQSLFDIYTSASDYMNSDYELMCLGLSPSLEFKLQEHRDFYVFCI